MKFKTQPKILLAALFIGLSATPFAMAETTVYGQAHLSFDSVDNGTDTGMQAASNSSRFGIKGNTDLGSLTGVYQFEVGVDLTGRGNADGNGPGTANNLFSTARDSFAGISGDFGTIIGGRLGVVNQWLYDVNLFGDQVGDLGNFWGADVGVGRANGVMAYASPNINGLDFTLAFKPDEGTADTAATVAKVNFAAGDLKLGLGYTDLGKAILGGTDNLTATAITASYNLSGINLVAGYQNTTNIGSVKDANTNTATAGVSAPIADGMSIKGQFTQVSAKAKSSGATGIALGLDYSLGKDTTAYVAYASTSNDDNASYTANNWGHGGPFGGPAAGKDASAVSVGIVHKFGGKL